MSEIKICQHTIERVKSICEEYGNEAGELINVLHKTQEEFGYLPPEIQKIVARYLNIPVSKVYGVVTFYSFFTMLPKGKNPISLCMGTACYVRGAEKVLDELQKQLGIRVGETTKDGMFSLDSLRCVGACGLAPVLMIGNRVYGRVEVSKIKDILEEYYALEAIEQEVVQ